MTKKKLAFLLALLLIVSLVAPSVSPLKTETAHASVSHPFLMVTENTDPQGLRPSFADLQARASDAPWSTMKADAISYVNSTTYDTGAIASQKHLNIRKIAMTGALAYMTDSANKTSYKNKVRDALLYWDDARAAYLAQYGPNSWDANVPVGGSLVASIVALDIIYNDLTPTERTEIETMIGTAVDGVRDDAWKTNGFGVKAVWDIYNTGTSSYVANYMTDINTEIASDGAARTSSEYAWARYGGTRIAKSMAPHIFEATGQSQDFYTYSRLRHFHEWLFTVGLTPLKRPTTFGHSNNAALLTLPGRDNTASTIGFGQYNANVPKYVAWLYPDLDTGYAINDILFSYILRDSHMPAAEAPKSKVYSNSAGFWENSSESTALMGALYSIPSIANHAFYQTNALNLNAYGEYLVRNVGYGSFQTNLDSTYTWSGYADNSKSQSVVEINNVSHASRNGGGITEGFVNGKLEYASAGSANALSNGSHQRNLVMVHPQDGKNGYFLVFDEVQQTNPAHTVNVRWRPDSETYTTVTADTEYRYTINRFSGHNVFANFFLATPPSSVAIQDGAFANHSTDGGTTYNKDLVPTYSGANKNVVTVIYPSDNTHAKATFARLSGTGYTGASIDSGSGIVDYALESNGAADRTVGAVTFKGKATVYRTDNGSNSFYFVRKGTTFNDGATPRKGFDANADVSLYMDGISGNIVSPGTNVTFHYPGITAVKLNGVTQSAISSGSGYVQINVPSGTRTVTLETTGGSGGAIRVEAESMALTQYTVEANANASGGHVIMLNHFQTGSAKFNFNGSSGTHTIRVRYFDENDGPVTMNLYVNQTLVDSWSFDVNDHAFHTRTKTGVSLNSGDEVRVEATYIGGEHARVDYIEIEPSVVRVEAENMALTQYTVEANANASGGHVIMLNHFQTGSAKFNFGGSSGTHTIRVRYFDENDGPVTMNLYVNQTVVDSWSFDVNDHAFHTRTKTGVSLNSGDEIRVEATYNGGEHARVDYIEIVS